MWVKFTEETLLGMYDQTDNKLSFMRGCAMESVVTQYIN